MRLSVNQVARSTKTMTRHDLLLADAASALDEGTAEAVAQASDLCDQVLADRPTNAEAYFLRGKVGARAAGLGGRVFTVRM